MPRFPSPAIALALAALPAVAQAQFSFPPPPGLPPAPRAASVPAGPGGPPRALTAPIVIAPPPANFARAMLGGDKLRPKVFVPSYRVAFLVSASAGAMSVSAASGVETVLSGAEPALMQGIVDRAYADFLERLAAGGFTVVPETEWKAAPAAAGLQKRAGDVEFKRRAESGVVQTYALVHPAALGPWAESTMPPNAGPVRALHQQLDATMLAPRFTVNYVQVSAQSGAMAPYAFGAQASYRPMVHGGPVIPGFGMESWRVRVGQYGGALEYRTDAVLMVPGDFGVAVGPGGARPTSLAGQTIDSWEGRLGQTYRTAAARFEVNPESYTRLALQALALQNQVAVDELKKIRR